MILTSSLIAMFVPLDADLYYYCMRYEDPTAYYGGDGKIEDMAIGYGVLEACAQAFGMDFRGFLVCTVTVCTVLVYFSYNRLTSASATAMGLFMLYPFILFIGQLRTGVSSSLLLAGVAILVTDDKKGSGLYWLLFVLAVSIHYTFVVFVFIWFLWKWDPSSWKVAFLSITLAVAGTLVIFSDANLLLNKIFAVIYPRAVRDGWFSFGTSLNLKGMLFVLAIPFALIAGSCIASKGARSGTALYGTSSAGNRDKVAALCKNICILSLVNVPICWMNPISMRYFRFAIVLLIPVFVGFVSKRWRSNDFRLAYVLCILFLVLLFVKDACQAQLAWQSIMKSFL